MRATTPRYSPGLVFGVAADEVFLAIAMAPSRFPGRADYARVSAGLADAEQLFAARGWIADPSTYHRTTPALDDSQVQSSRGWALWSRAWTVSSSEPTKIRPTRGDNGQVPVPSALGWSVDGRRRVPPTDGAPWLHPIGWDRA